MRQRPLYLKILFWLIPLAFMALIFNMSHQPGGESGRLSRLVLGIVKGFGYDLMIVFGESATWWVRKVAHASEYGLLTILLFNAFHSHFRLKTAILAGMFSAMIYSATDEFHQTFVPGRVGNIGDVGIDSLGCIMATGLLFYAYWVQNRADEGAL